MSWMFIALVMTILLTPGPTNTLLASSGIQVGFQKSLHLIPAEALGYLIAISIWGIFVDRVAETLPFLPALLKLLSAMYILFLAVKLWKSAANTDLNKVTIIGPRQLFLATLLNPKALLFASAVFPLATWNSVPVYMQNMVVFLLLLVPIAFFWVFMGYLLTSNRISWLNQRNLQRTASLILISFSVPLSYSAMTSL
ncbi:MULTISPECIES: LysE family translocator [unclassified Acinetobacter]|uniref:LysE family translocator n=1 Tax=unclassified Acinetobacter TaxID=196816 RepID=UPI00235EBEB2|nr:MULTISPECIES: LysE family transporter [unclassified Acinetobacter]